MAGGESSGREVLELGIASGGAVAAGFAVTMLDEFPLILTMDDKSGDFDWKTPEENLPVLDVIGGALIALGAVGAIVAARKAISRR